MGCSQAVTHAALNETQHHDILFIREPFIHKTNRELADVSHPAWKRVTPLTAWTKLVAFVNKRVKSVKGSINASGTVGTVTIALTNIVGIYLNGKSAIEDIRDDLLHITRAGRVAVMGDFNAHSTTWGSSRSNPRGKEAVNWATAGSMAQHVSQPTWRRQAKESTLDLIFTNPLTNFSHNNLHHTHLGSDHDLISGTFTALVPGNRTYKTPDWDLWRK